MRTKTAFARTVTCRYLYHDGTLLTMFDETRNGIKIGETVDVIYGYAAEVWIYPNYESRRRFSATPTHTNGRIVFHRYAETGMINVIKGAVVEAILPSLSAGSENTKTHGISVGYLNVNTKKLGKFSWTVLDGLISDGLTLQSGSEYTGSFAKDGSTLKPGEMWGLDCRVNKVTDLRTARAETATAAL